MNTRTRALTGKSSAGIPVRIHGFVRRWNARIPSQKTTALGLEPHDDAHVNGILIEVAVSELEKFDWREHGYTRVHVPVDRVEGAEVDVWTYVPDEFILADETHPICHTYLDATVAGCLDVSEAFAREFVETTLDWHLPWIRDRDCPVYPRALDGIDHEQVDAVLQIIRKKDKQ